MTEATVTIDHLGGLGDGVAETPTGRLHIPFTAPGDRLNQPELGCGVRELLFGAEGPVFTGRVASHRVPHRDYGDTTAFTLLCPSRDGPRIFNFGIGG